MRSALTFRSPNMVVLGGVSSTLMLQPIGKSPDPRDVMESSITPCHDAMWQGNTTPVFWSTFQVKILNI